MSESAETKPLEQTKEQVADHDAPRKEVILYAVGNVEGGIANQYFNILNTLTVVVMGMNPLIIGFIISIKTIWDAITDPIMAQITDNARTRWGRRIPFILTGGLGRVLLLLAIFVFFPRDPSLKTNEQFKREKDERAAHVEQEKHAKELSEQSAAAESAASAGSEEIFADDPVVGAVAHQTPKSMAADLAQQEATEQGGALSQEQPPGEDEPDVANVAAEKAKEAAPQPVTPQKRPGFAQQWQAFMDFFVSPSSEYHRTVALYLLISSLLFALFSTVQSVPYYALGIELCPSYAGRTRVVVFRSYVDKAMSLVAPWVIPFIFLPMFHTAIDGLVWYAIFVAAIGAPTTIAMCMGIKERSFHPEVKRPKPPPLLKSMWLTAKNIHFLKILFLYVFIGFTNSLFAQVGAFLVLFWVFAGDVVAGGVVNGYASTIAVILGFATLPLIQWAANRFGKHVALRWALIWMSIGTFLRWFIYNPDYPYLQLVLPFFFSVGIGSVYTILPSMMADVTDVDELNTGVRREGMFGAVMAFLMKAIGSVQPVLAALVLVISGFDPALGPDQPPEIFLRMRILDAFVPAFLLLFALIVLYKYPLTRERMEEIKATLAERRAKAVVAGAAVQGPQTA